MGKCGAVLLLYPRKFQQEDLKFQQEDANCIIREGPSGHNKNSREEVDDEFGDCIMSKEDLEFIDFKVASARLQASYQKKLTAAGQEVAEHAAACMYFAVYKKLGFVQQVQGGSTTQEACTAVRSNIISLDGENDAREDHYKPMAGSVAAGFLPVD